MVRDSRFVLEEFLLEVEQSMEETQAKLAENLAIKALIVGGFLLPTLGSTTKEIIIWTMMCFFLFVANLLKERE